MSDATKFPVGDDGWIDWTRVSEETAAAAIDHILGSAQESMMSLLARVKIAASKIEEWPGRRHGDWVSFDAIADALDIHNVGEDDDRDWLFDALRGWAEEGRCRTSGGAWLWSPRG